MFTLLIQTAVLYTSKSPFSSSLFKVKHVQLVCVKFSNYKVGIARTWVLFYSSLIGDVRCTQLCVHKKNVEKRVLRGVNCNVFQAREENLITHYPYIDDLYFCRVGNIFRHACCTNPVRAHKHAYTHASLPTQT